MDKESLKIGFIGGGAMAEALVRGMLSKKVAAAGDVYLSERQAQRRSLLRERYHVHAVDGADEFLPMVDMLFLAVKPQDAEAAMQEVAPKAKAGLVVVSIVAGLTLDRLETHFASQPAVRVMPNTPLSVGEGMSAYALGKRASEADGEAVGHILSAVGRAICVKEQLMDAVTGLSGSGPAYAFLMIDALADGGVAAGLPRQAAITLAAQTFLGAAKMVLETGKHPDELRDQVTSPAGTTIAGVRVMEQRGVRGALLDAVLAAAEKSRMMGK